MFFACRYLTIVIVIGAAGFFVNTGHAQTMQGKGYEREPDAIFRGFPTAPRYRAFLPAELDLSSRFPPPGSQGSQSSCTAWAVGYALRSYHEGRRRNWRFDSQEQLISPAYIYNSLHGFSGDCSAGTGISRALELLQRDGAPTLARYPYSDDNCSRTPDAKAVSLASEFRIKGWRALDGKKLDDAKGQINLGNPVVFGMEVSKSFDQLKGDTIYDDTTSPREGGHAMVLVGYSDRRQAFKLINSWSTNWGDKGFGWVSYRALSQLSDRMFVMDVGPDLPPPPPEVVVAPPSPLVTPSVPVKVEPLLPAIQARVAARLRDVPCASLEGSVSAEGTVRVRGFAGGEGDVAKLRDELLAMPGVRRVESEARVYPWPQCEVFLSFSEAIAERSGITARLGGGEGNNFRAGDSLSIEVMTPNYPSYLYVSYLQASGEVAHLSWPEGRFPKALAPNSRITFGGGANGQPVYRIGQPFGDELVVVVASASPLFQDKLPETATDREYLTSFRKAFLVRPKGGSGQRRVSAVAVPLKTAARM